MSNVKWIAGRRGVTGRKPATRYCCGNGILEPAEGDGTICNGNPVTTTMHGVYRATRHGCLAGGGLTLHESAIKAAGIDLTGLPSFEGIGGGGPVKVTPFRVKRVSFGGAVKTDTTGMAGEMPPSVEYQHGFRIGGIISHGFFRADALTFDFDKMRFLLQNGP